MNKLKKLTTLAFAAIAFGAFTSCQKAENANAPANQPVNRAASNTIQPVSSPVANTAPAADGASCKAAMVGRESFEIIMSLQ